jgi:hypothetical protein
MNYPKHKLLVDFKRIIISDLAIHWFFNEYDVYYSSIIESDFLLKDCGYPSKKDLRKSWVFSNTGYISEIHHHYTFVNRLSEFITVQDNPNSLRQKLNILHIMNECNFEPNNPIHISVLNSYNKNENILDLDNKNTWNNFQIIVHPGHTRVVGSVFLNESIKNNFLYVNKKSNFKVIGKNVKKLNISNFKDYFSDKFSKKQEDSIQYKCFSWNQPNMTLKETFKVSHENENFLMQILKLYIFFEYKEKSLESKSIGSSYIYNTFTYSNSYFKTLFNNKLFVYSIDKHETYDLLFTNLKNLFSPNMSNNDLRYLIDDFIQSYTYNSDGMIEGLSNALPIFDEKENEILELFKDLFKKIKLSEKPKFYIQSNPILDKSNFLSINKNNETFYNIVEKNNFKGFAIFVDNTKIGLENFDRTLPELLYIANPTVSIVRSVNNEFAIINCEDEYWKTNQNYKEVVIQKSFYEN